MMPAEQATRDKSLGTMSEVSDIIVIGGGIAGVPVEAIHIQTTRRRQSAELPKLRRPLHGDLAEA